MKQKTIYIAGPMRGIEFFNFRAFDAARDRLKAEGWNVISPADMDREAGFDEKTFKEEDLTKEMMDEFFDRDVAAIRRSDAIYLLKGWQNSTGAKAEYHLALWRHLAIFEEEHESVLDEAKRITSGERMQNYGGFKINHQRIADLWNAYLGIRTNPKAIVSDKDAAFMMMFTKVARHVHRPIRDNCVDGPGYWRGIARIDGFEE